jgi:hypothetical protein
MIELQYIQPMALARTLVTCGQAFNPRQPRPLRKNFPGMAPVGTPSSKVISPFTMIQS